VVKGKREDAVTGKPVSVTKTREPPIMTEAEKASKRRDPEGAFTVFK
jgi:hypothetical protein